MGRLFGSTPGFASLVLLMVVAGCATIPDPQGLLTSEPDGVHVVLWRETEEQILGYVPVCPGERVLLGISNGEGLPEGDDSNQAGNEGQVVFTRPGLLEFSLDPESAASGSLTSSLPPHDVAAPYVFEVTSLAQLGGFFVETERTYAAIELDSHLPEVGQGWLFVGGGKPSLVNQKGAELEAALASLDCD